MYKIKNKRENNAKPQSQNLNKKKKTNKDNFSL